MKGKLLLRKFGWVFVVCVQCTLWEYGMRVICCKEGSWIHKLSTQNIILMSMRWDWESYQEYLSFFCRTWFGIVDKRNSCAGKVDIYTWSHIMYHREKVTKWIFVHFNQVSLCNFHFRLVHCVCVCVSNQLYSIYLFTVSHPLYLMLIFRRDIFLWQLFFCSFLIVGETTFCLVKCFIIFVFFFSVCT